MWNPVPEAYATWAATARGSIALVSTPSGTVTHT